MSKITVFNTDHPDDNNHLLKRDLHNASEPFIEVVKQANEDVECAVERRRSSLIQSLFPDAVTKEIVKQELIGVKDQYEFRRQVLRKVRETQLQSFTEVCNQYLDRQKAEIRTNTAQFLMAKHLELQKELERLSDEFSDEMDKSYQNLEKIKSPFLRKTREAQLERNIEGFARQQRILMQRFEQIIFEGV